MIGTVRGGRTELHELAESAAGTLVVETLDPTEPEQISALRDRPADPRTLLLISPGWVRTELGGLGAPLTIDQSIPGVAGTIERHASEPGLQFRNDEDQVVPW